MNTHSTYIPFQEYPSQVVILSAVLKHLPNSRTIPSPIPLDPPVTIVTLSLYLKLPLSPSMADYFACLYFSTGIVGSCDQLVVRHTIHRLPRDHLLRD